MVELRSGFGRVFTILFIFCIITCYLVNPFAMGYSSYSSALPGDLSADCTVCHVAGDMSSLNDFGTAFSSISGHDSDPAAAISEISDADSDGDGYSNVRELENATNPGDPADFPSLTPKVPKLKIVNFTKSSKKTVEGDKLLLYAKVINEGEGDAEDVRVTVTCEKDLIEQSLRNLTIKSGESQWVIFNVCPCEGNYKYKIDAVYSEGMAIEHIYIHVDPKPQALPGPDFLMVLVPIVVMAFLLRFKKTGKGGGGR